MSFAAEAWNPLVSIQNPAWGCDSKYVMCPKVQILGANRYMVEMVEFEQSTVAFVLPVIPRFIIVLI